MVLWVVIPALNEAENLEVVVPRICEVLARAAPSGHVLVVDDGSSDDTADVMAKLIANLDRVHVEVLRRNMGKAAALHAGFERALGEGADTIVMMDADGQDDPEELEKVLAPLQDGSADLVTGARTVRHDRFVKRNTSKLYNGVTRMLSGTPGRDFNSGYKAMRADVVRDLLPMLYGEMHRYITVLAHQAGYRVTERTVQHHPRLMGTSKYGLARFWRGFSDLITVRFLLSYENRPSHLFGGVGMLSFLVGAAILAYLTVVKLAGGAIGDRPLLLAGVLFVLVGMQLVLFGLLAELVVHARNRSLRVPSEVRR